MAKAKAKTTLAVEHVPIDSVHLDPANVRKHPERNLSAIKASLARFGQQKPIIVDGDGIVRAGNGALEAAKALCWETIAIVRTSLTGSEATAYAIADNRTSELGEWDQTGLAEQLRALQGENIDLASVGYTDEELDGLIDRLAGELEEATGGEESVPEKYELIIECRSESHQQELYESFQKQGITCRVLTL